MVLAKLTSPLSSSLMPGNGRTNGNKILGIIMISSDGSTVNIFNPGLDLLEELSTVPDTSCEYFENARKVNLGREQK